MVKKAVFLKLSKDEAKLALQTTEQLQNLYTQLEAELPEHLKTHVTLEADETKDCINVKIKDMGELGKENFKQLRSLLEGNFDAVFINPAFPQQPYYTVKLKQSVALPTENEVRDVLIKKAQALNLGLPDATLLTMPLAKLETLVKTATKLQSDSCNKVTDVTKLPSNPAPEVKKSAAKQASPLRQYFINNNCAESCEAWEVCSADTTYSAIHICLEIRKYEMMIQQAFEAEHAKAEAAAGPPPQVQPKREAPQQQSSGKGSVESWISALKWEAAKTNTGKDCEKAYELQNLNVNLLKDEYVHLLDELKRRKAAGEKNYIAGYLFFHTEQGENPYLGRMHAQGGRR